MGGQSSQQSTQQNSLPWWAQGPYRGAVGGVNEAQGNLPSISQQYSDMPMLNIPGLTPEQMKYLSSFENMPTGANQYEQNAANQIAQLTSGDIGSSPATIAAEKAFKDFQLPMLQSQAANMGQGNSGALLEASSQGAERASIPFIQQEIANREASIGQSAQLGSQIYSQDVQTLSNALEAAGLPREVALQQAQALFQQQQQKQNLAEQVQMGPFNQIPSIFGKGTSVSTSSNPKM